MSMRFLLTNPRERGEGTNNVRHTERRSPMTRRITNREEADAYGWIVATAGLPPTSSVNELSVGSSEDAASGEPVCSARANTHLCRRQSADRKPLVVLLERFEEDGCI